MAEEGKSTCFPSPWPGRSLGPKGDANLRGHHPPASGRRVTQQHGSLAPGAEGVARQTALGSQLGTDTLLLRARAGAEAPGPGREAGAGRPGPAGSWGLRGPGGRAPGAARRAPEGSLSAPEGSEEGTEAAGRRV